MKIRPDPTCGAKVFDAITGEEIRFVTWIDGEAGTYEVLSLKDGKPFFDPATNDAARETRKGQVRVKWDLQA